MLSHPLEILGPQASLRISFWEALGPLSLGLSLLLIGPQ